MSVRRVVEEFYKDCIGRDVEEFYKGSIRLSQGLLGQSGLLKTD